MPLFVVQLPKTLLNFSLFFFFFYFTQQRKLYKQDHV